MLPKRNSTDEIGVRAAFARKIARRAGGKAKRLFSHPRRLTAQVKSSPQDLVSEADRSVEAYLRHQISSHFPDDAIIGEENVPTDGRSAFKWVIDPIDGTMAFLTGQPNWTVSIAVLEGDELVAGVVFAPVLKEIYHAMRGQGAWLNGRQLLMPDDWTIATIPVGFGATERADADQAGEFVTRLYREGGVIFRVGSGALMLAYVAASRLCGYYDPRLFSWDCMAGLLLIREAGGQAEFTGTLLDPGPIWAGNAHVFADLKRISEAAEPEAGARR
ncbi:inositol monophosphatase family protein [Agrobacterium tumefaciens]|jgi:myo-inositol-1(or 4)-monophosphatase|uniref:inositol monophosphatase family protein n=1 Tax=Agrobacterium tumefaciens TaxID=358 RepID=UPI000459F067|nr:inositol monophosphatase [Agrobacterium tumefaciens]CDN92309.1 Inositol monophosphatase/fructose-1,6-bisphosphatase family protein [Agrobacterium tumefaciens]